MLTELKRIYKLTRIKQKKQNVSFGHKANISVNTIFEGQNKIGKFSWLDGFLGYGSYIGDECTIFAKVGKYCSIGHKVTVLTGTHPSHEYVSTNPVFFSLGKQNGTTYVKTQKFREKVYADEQHKYGAIIGNDVWIGYNATIMGGSVIGDGAIVASGALVNNDVEPYTIVAGQPAKVIGKRFTDEQIEWLLQFKWWDKPVDWIVEHAEEFDNIDMFKSTHSKMGND